MTLQPDLPTIRLMLIDDHPVLRAGLANLLAIEKGLSVVAQAGSGEVAVQLCRRHSPDVCLLDLSMPGIDGLETLKRILSVAASKIVVLTSSESPADADRAFAAGAHGYLTKTVPFTEIVATIREVHRGVNGLCKGIPRKQVAAGPSPLSPREHSVLLLLRRGLSNPEIGRTLGISERTAKWHVKAILEKLGASDRTAAVAKAFDLGILAPESSPRTPSKG
jgi:DNA-binding NarL/FixJ family response regulator